MTLHSSLCICALIFTMLFSLPRSPKQSVSLCRVPLQALPVHVPDPTASQPLGFCREPASDHRQTQRWLSAVMFPSCRSCRRRTACALAALQGSAAGRARGLLAHGATGVGAATAQGNRPTLWLLPALVSGDFGGGCGDFARGGGGVELLGVRGYRRSLGRSPRG